MGEKRGRRKNQCVPNRVAFTRKQLRDIEEVRASPSWGSLLLAFR